MLALTAPQAALACSICRCGDPTFNAMGVELYTSDGLYLGLDWDRAAKSQGSGDERESITENRYTAAMLYGLSERWLLSARLPFSHRAIRAADPAEGGSASGPADPELALQYRVWASRMEGDVGQRSSVALMVGVKTPWGENNRRGGDRERLDEHLQPGTGSTDLIFGVSGFHLLNRSSTLFASLQWRQTGANDYGYRYGRAFLANLAYEHKLLPALDSVLELNYRDARRDEVDTGGSLDEDTGGRLLYLSPRLLLDVGHGLVLRVGAQIPVYRSLNGHQHEKAVYNAGFTYGLGRW